LTNRSNTALDRVNAIVIERVNDFKVGSLYRDGTERGE